MKATRSVILFLFVSMIASMAFAANKNPNNSDCSCTKIYQPVCGVDGKTYANACMAACAKVSVAGQGECAPKAPQKLIGT